MVHTKVIEGDMEFLKEFFTDKENMTKFKKYYDTYLLQVKINEYKD